MKGALKVRRYQTNSTYVYCITFVTLGSLATMRLGRFLSTILFCTNFIPPSNKNRCLLSAWNSTICFDSTLSKYNLTFLTLFDAMNWPSKTPVSIGLDKCKDIQVATTHKKTILQRSDCKYRLEIHYSFLKQASNFDHQKLLYQSDLKVQSFSLPLRTKRSLLKGLFTNATLKYHIPFLDCLAFTIIGMFLRFKFQCFERNRNAVQNAIPVG